MGRPRVHPEGSTAVDRVRARRRRLAAGGGGRREFELSADALAAISAIRQARDLPSDLAAVEWALLRGGGEIGVTGEVPIRSDPAVHRSHG